MSKGTVKIKGNKAIINFSHTSNVVVVGVLGNDFDSKGRIRVYLNSLIHSGNEFIGWDASGAISTILTKSGEGE